MCGASALGWINFAFSAVGSYGTVLWVLSPLPIPASSSKRTTFQISCHRLFMLDSGGYLNDGARMEYEQCASTLLCSPLSCLILTIYTVHFRSNIINIPCSLTVRIWPSQGWDPGSIPGVGTFFFAFLHYIEHFLVHHLFLLCLWPGNCRKKGSFVHRS